MPNKNEITLAEVLKTAGYSEDATRAPTVGAAGRLLLLVATRLNGRATAMSWRASYRTLALNELPPEAKAELASDLDMAAKALATMAIDMVKS